MSSHLFGTLFLKLEGYDGELGTRLFVILYLAGLCKGAKLEVETRMGLICQRYEDVNGSNAVTFIGDKTGDV